MSDTQYFVTFGVMLVLVFATHGAIFLALTLVAGEHLGLGRRWWQSLGQDARAVRHAEQLIEQFPLPGREVLAVGLLPARFGRQADQLGGGGGDFRVFVQGRG